MSGWGQVTWDIARAGGFVAYGLLTLAVALGLALSMRWQSSRWPRLINSELHNFVTLLSLVFIIIHVLAVWIDPFTQFGWAEVFIPFVSHYRPLWMAFGIVALYLGLALAASVWLRPYIGYEWWRRLHALTLVSYVLVTIHGVATGSDTRTVWGVLVYGASALTIASLMWIRFLIPVGPQQRRHPVWVGVTALGLFLGVIASMLGPLRPGWNALANGSSGSGQRGVATQTAATSSTKAAGSSTGASSSTAQNTGAMALPFVAQVSGTESESGPDANGNTTITLHLTLQDQTGGKGTMVVTLAGPQGSDGAVNVTNTSMALGPVNGAAAYQGPITDLRVDDFRWFIGGALQPASGGGTPVTVQMRVRISNDGQVSGSAQGAAGASQSQPSQSGGDD